MLDSRYIFFLWNYKLYRFDKLNKDPHAKAEIWRKGGIFDFFDWKWKKSSLTMFQAEHLKFWDWESNGYFVSNLRDITWRFPGAGLD